MIRSDWRAYHLSIKSFVKGLFTGHSFFAVLIYRMGHYLHKKRIKLVPDILKFISLRNFGCEISPYACVGSGFKVLHTAGIVIGHQVTIGDDCEIFQNVTIGSNRKTKNGREMPEIGNKVTICAGAVIIGAIRIGDNVVIGANSVVTNDIPSNCVVAGVPAKIIGNIEVYRKDRT